MQVILLKLICLEDPFTAFSSQLFYLCDKLQVDACLSTHIEEVMTNVMSSMIFSVPASSLKQFSRKLAMFLDSSANIDQH